MKLKNLLKILHAFAIEIKAKVKDVFPFTLYALFFLFLMAEPSTFRNLELGIYRIILATLFLIGIANYGGEISKKKIDQSFRETLVDKGLSTETLDTISRGTVLNEKLIGKVLADRFIDNLHKNLK